VVLLETEGVIASAGPTTYTAEHATRAEFMHKCSSVRKLLKLMGIVLLMGGLGHTLESRACISRQAFRKPIES
jgi:hypothetical protein